MKKFVFIAFLLNVSSYIFSQPKISSLFHSSFQEKSIVIDGNINMSYAEQGAPGGTPVLFVHGYPDSWHSYEEVLQELPKSIHAFAVSLRGFGNSDRPDKNYAPKNFSDDLASFVKKINIGPVIIVGHSMGGIVVQRFAIDYPELTRGMVIIGSQVSFNKHKDLKEFGAEINKMKDPIKESFIIDFQRSTIADPINESFFNTLISESAKAPLKVWQESMNELLIYEPGELLKNIHIPSLIVWGDKDMICFRKDIEFLHQSIRNSLLLVYENTGHSVHWEEPKRFSEDLMDFINNLNTTSLLKEKTIELPGNLFLSYVEQGNNEGLPVILLHGYTDSWHSFDSVLRNLPKNIHAFAISQRGHGNSDKPASGYSPKDFANDVAAFVEKRKLGPVVIVGHSMGGVVVQRFAMDHPELTKAVVIIGSATSVKNFSSVNEFVDVVNQLNDPIEPAFAEEFQKSTLAKPINNLYYKELVGESLKVPARVWKTILNDLMNYDPSAELINLRKPTLVIWGDQDIFCNRESQFKLLELIKDSRILVYKGTGHAVHWEEPQRFSNDLVMFIKKLDKAK